MSVSPPNLFGPVDWYRTIRDQIQHEDNLIVQRLSWLMAAQSFFFTGYAIIANASPRLAIPYWPNNKTSSSILFQGWHAFPIF